MTTISMNVFSQESGLLDSLPTTREGFIKSEPAVINTINWLENTPFDQEPEKRKLLSAQLLAWLTNSPTVTVTFDSKLTPSSKKNAGLLIIFIGGWVKYSLQNNYSADAVQCNLAGLKSMLKVYQSGAGIKKEKEYEKLVELNEKGELEAWVRKQTGN